MKSKDVLHKLRIFLTKILSLGKKIIFEDFLVLILIFSTWFKLIYLDRLIYDWPILTEFLIFTLASSVIIFSPAFLLKKFKQIFIFSAAFIASFIIWANTVYFRFFGSLIRIESLAIAKQAADVSDSVAALVRPNDFLFFIDIVILIGVIIIFKIKPRQIKGLKERALVFTFFILLSIISISTILYRDRYEHLEKFIYRNFDINQIERRYGAFGVHGINAYRFLFVSNLKISQERELEVVDWIKNNKTSQQDNELTGIANGKNIFLVQLESVQTFAIGKKFEGQEITPNINRLIESSHYFPNGQYMTGGGKTSDSDFSANTSLYPLPDSSVFVQHARHEFTSLPKALSSEGYKSYAYHAYKRDFWNRNLAFNSLGFDRYYAEDNYPEGTNIIMGLNDEDFYRESLNKIKNKQGPNYHYLISLTSHYPFDMAPEHLYLKGDVSRYDYRTYHYYQAIHYADRALGIFIDGLKKEGLYEDSLIIVYGDHNAKVGDLNDPLTQKTLGINGISEEVLYDLQKVPFVLKIPNQTQKNTHEKVVSQLDLMPTVLNLVGIKTTFPMFGADFFGSRESRYFSSLHELSGLSVVANKVSFFSYLTKSDTPGCFNLGRSWREIASNDCEDFLRIGAKEKEYSWDLIKHNLFSYFY